VGFPQNNPALCPMPFSDSQMTKIQRIAKISKPKRFNKSEWGIVGNSFAAQ
jgi:hypothetical protein